MGVLSDIKDLTQGDLFSGSDVIPDISKFQSDEIPLESFRKNLTDYSPLQTDFVALAKKYENEIGELPLDSAKLSDFFQDQTNLLSSKVFSDSVDKVGEFINGLGKLSFPDLSNLFSSDGSSSVSALFPDGQTLVAFFKTLLDVLKNFASGSLFNDFLELFEKLLLGLKDMSSDFLDDLFSAVASSDSLEKALEKIKKALSSGGLETLLKQLDRIREQYDFESMIESMNGLGQQLNTGKIDFDEDLDKLEEQLNSWLKKLESGATEQFLFGFKSIHKFLKGPVGSHIFKLKTADWKNGEVDRDALDQLLEQLKFQEEVNQLNNALKEGFDQLDALGMDAAQSQLTSVNDSLLNISDGATDLIHESGKEISIKLHELNAVIKTIEGEALKIIREAEEAFVAQLKAFFQPIEEILKVGTDKALQALEKLDVQMLRVQMISFLTTFRDKLDSSKALSLVETLEEMVRALRKIRFNSATGSIIEALKVITKTLKVVKMVPLTKSVTEKIEELTASFPDNLDPLVSEITSELKELIHELEEWEVFAQIKAASSKILEEIDKFDLQKLVDQYASEPFNSFAEVVSELEIKKLIEPLDEEFTHVTNKLAQALDTTDLQSKTGEVFKDLEKQIDLIQPKAMATTLASSINESIQSLANEIQISSFLGELEKQTAELENGLDPIKDMVIDFFDAIYQVFEELKQNKQALEKVIHEIIDQIEGVNKVLPLDQWLNEIKPTLSEILEFIKVPIQEIYNRVSDESLVQKKIEEILVPLKSHLEDNTGHATQNKLAGVFQKLEQFSLKLNALASPLDLVIQTASRWQQLDEEGIDWSPLDSFLSNAHWNHLNSYTDFFFEIIEHFKASIQRTEETLKDGINLFDEKLQDLTSIISTLNQINDSLASMTLVKEEVIEAELSKLIREVKAQLSETNPSTLILKINTSIEDLLDSISPSELLSLDKMDENYEELLKEVEEKNPSNWIDAAVHSELDSVKAVLRKYDISKLIDQLIQLLYSLERQLSSELNKTSKAYSEMQAVLRSDAVKIPVKLPAIKPPKVEALNKVSKLKAKF